MLIFQGLRGALLSQALMHQCRTVPDALWWGTTMAALSGNQMKAVLYILLNIGSGTSIVFANKIVLSVYKFHFVYALTLIHTAVTMVCWNLSVCCASFCLIGPTMCVCTSFGMV